MLSQYHYPIGYKEIDHTLSSYEQIDNDYSDTSCTKHDWSHHNYCVQCMMSYITICRYYDSERNVSFYEVMTVDDMIQFNADNYELDVTVLMTLRKKES